MTACQYVCFMLCNPEEAKALTAKARTRLRRSSVGNIRRARSRTLKMTLVIGKLKFIDTEIIPTGWRVETKSLFGHLHVFVHCWNEHVNPDRYLKVGGR